jgi:hypothetical protein
MNPTTNTEAGAVADVARVAWNLTPAQREVVLALDNAAWRNWPEGRLQAMWDGLGKSGLQDLFSLALVDRGPPRTLTRFGKRLAIYLAAHLSEQGATAGVKGEGN